MVLGLKGGKTACLCEEEACLLHISVVGYIADSESALYDTVLIPEYSADSIFKF
jgi:hypothetical protein